MAAKDAPHLGAQDDMRDQEVVRAYRVLAAYFEGRRTEREARASLKIIKSFIRDRQRADPRTLRPLPRIDTGARQEDGAERRRSMRRLFVVGSLRQGEYNHERFAGFGDRPIATGTISGAILKNMGEYPAMVPSANAHDRVVGEVYEISDAIGEVIDQFERADEFEARQVNVVVAGPKTEPEDSSLETAQASGPAAIIQAEAYFYAHPVRLADRDTVEGGDWVRWKSRTRSVK